VSKRPTCSLCHLPPRLPVGCEAGKLFVEMIVALLLRLLRLRPPQRPPPLRDLSERPGTIPGYSAATDLPPASAAPTQSYNRHRRPLHGRWEDGSENLRGYLLSGGL
jgi:hypothetical protein